MKETVAMILSLCLMLGVTGAISQENTMEAPDMSLMLKDGQAVIYVAGGCFWGMEKLMSVIPGIIDAVSGYANGSAVNPTYQQVCAGGTGHRETVRVVYRPDEVSLEAILYVYFSNINPSVKNRQGNDIGSQYQTGVYYTGDEDGAVVRAVADAQRARHEEFYVEIAPLTSFYEAEEYHQDYLDKHPGGYCHIPAGAFEAAQSMTVDPAGYEKPGDEELARSLTGLQYAVTQQSATERPFTGEYWDNTEDGLYVDITTGEPLFTSADKYPSSCGWPAFGKGLDDNALSLKQDDSHGMSRTEVRSRVGDAHLGHVFEGDSESPTGTRYCINSAALRFVPYESMEAEGYGKYMKYVREPSPEYRKVSAAEAKRIMDEQPEALVIDVRSREEFAQGHIPGALLLPLPDIGSEPPALLPDKHATMLVYCRSGVRSKEAANKLVALGYTAVYDMGGINGWPYDVVTD